MSAKSDFMAAEEIKAILQGREKPEQERIMRWVSESLGVAAAPSQPAAVVSPAMPAGSAHPIGSHAGSNRAKDIKSFVNEKNPKSDVQFAAVVAYFYRFEAPQADRKDAIVATDLQESGRQARGYGFKKPIITLTNALKQGYFDRGGRGEFKLNAVGENLVAMTLPGGTAGNSGNGQPRPRKQQKKKKGNQRKGSAKKPKAS